MTYNSQHNFEWKVSQRKHTLGDPIEPPRPSLRVGVLISGSGSNLQALIDAIETSQLPGVEIALVVSNNAQAQGVQRAFKHMLPTIYLPWGKIGGAQFTADQRGGMSPDEKKHTSLLQLFQVDLIVLAGLMPILIAALLALITLHGIYLHYALLPCGGTS